MSNIKIKRNNKILGAIVSSVCFSLFFVFIEGIIVYFQITEVDKIPTVLFIFISLILMGPVVGIAINLVNRIKEVLGGEEDEASKY